MRHRITVASHPVCAPSAQPKLAGRWLLVLSVSVLATARGLAAASSYRFTVVKRRMVRSSDSEQDLAPRKRQRRHVFRGLAKQLEEVRLLY